MAVLCCFLLVSQLPDGSEIPLPPILLGKLGSDPRKKTVCIYGHLDVQPAALEDGWDSEPFTLVERDGEGRFPLAGEASGEASLLSCLRKITCFLSRASRVHIT